LRKRKKGVLCWTHVFLARKLGGRKKAWGDYSEGKCALGLDTYTWEKENGHQKGPDGGKGIGRPKVGLVVGQSRDSGLTAQILQKAKRVPAKKRGVVAGPPLGVGAWSWATHELGGQAQTENYDKGRLRAGSTPMPSGQKGEKRP